MKYFARFAAGFILAAIIIMLLAVKTILFDEYIKSIVIYIFRSQYGNEISINSFSKDIRSEAQVAMSGVCIKINDNYKIHIDKVKVKFNIFDFFTKSLLNFNFRLKHTKLYSNDNSERSLTDSTLNGRLSYYPQISKYHIYLSVNDICSHFVDSDDNYLVTLIKGSSYILKIDADKNISLKSLYQSIDDNKQDVLLSTDLKIELVNDKSVNIKGRVKGSNLPDASVHQLKHLLVDHKNWYNVVENINIGSVANANIDIDINASPSDLRDINIRDLSGSVLLNSSSITLQGRVKTTAVCNAAHVTFSNSKIRLSIPELNLSSTTANNIILEIDLSNSQDAVLHVSGIAEGPVADLINNFVSVETIHKLQTLDVDLIKSEGNAKTTFQFIMPLYESAKTASQYKVTSHINKFILPIQNDKFILSYEQLEINCDNNEVKIYSRGDGKINNIGSTFSYHKLMDSDNSEILNFNFVVNHNSNLGNDLTYCVIDGEATVNVQYKQQLDHQSIRITSDLTSLGFTLPCGLLTKDIGHKAYLQGYIDISNLDRVLVATELVGSNNLNIKNTVEYSKSKIKVDFPVIQHFDNDFKAQIIYANHHYDIKVYGETINISNLADFISQSNIVLSSLQNKNIKVDLKKIVVNNNIYLNSLYFILLHQNNAQADGRLSVRIDKNIINGLVTSDKFDKSYKCIISTDNAGSIVQALHISPNLQSGNLKIEIDIPKYGNDRVYGALHMTNFTTKKTSFFTHLVSFLSWHGLYDFIILRNMMYFSNMDINFDYDKGIIRILEGNVKGNSISFTVKGMIDLENRFYDVQGTCAPSIFGLNSIIKMISTKYRVKNSL